MTKPKSKPTESAKSKQSPKAAGSNSVVLFGADEFGKPRAARFTDADQALLMKAASTLHLRTIEVVGAELEDLAKKLPAGRLPCRRSRPAAVCAGRLVCRVDRTHGRRSETTGRLEIIEGAACQQR